MNQNRTSTTSRIFRSEKEERKELRDYQVEAVNSIMGSFEKFNKVLLILPTGTGKTIVFTEVIQYFLKAGKRCLVLAHREELIAQAWDKVKLQTGVNAGIEKAEKFTFLDSQVVIASVQSMGTKKRLEKFPIDHFGLIVVDEAHHAIAPSYQKILKRFNSKVLGVTATPDRADNKELGGYFEHVAYQYSLLTAIRKEYLVNIVGRRVNDFSIDLSDLRTKCGDFSEADLERVITDYIAPISDAIKRETAGEKTMIFLPTVKSSELTANVLNGMGIPAAFLSGASAPEERRLVLNRFKKGDITHLCNCNLFLEGFDEPSIETIVMARPTLSRTIFAQSVGRGTRPFPGKSNLKLVEFTYNSEKHKLVTAYELFSGVGFEEKVRSEAERRSAGKRDVDFLFELTEAHKDFYDVRRLLQKIRINEMGFECFDVFRLATLNHIDIEGEFDLVWNGHEVKGAITEKQSEFLKKYKISTGGLNRKQASLMISKIMDGSLRIPGDVVSSRQKYTLNKFGIDTQGMSGVKARWIIGKIAENNWSTEGLDL